MRGLVKTPVMTPPVKKRINTEPLIEIMTGIYLLRAGSEMINKGNQPVALTGLERQVYLALKRCGNEGSGGSLSRYE